MRILLKSHNSNTEYLEFGRYAIVDIDYETIKSIAARRKIFLAAREQDKRLHEMYFWDARAEFYGANIESDDIEETFDAMLGDKEWTELHARNAPRNIDHPKSPDRTDCDQMVIREEGVQWYAQDHYCDTTMTVCVLYEDLFKDKI